MFSMFISRNLHKESFKSLSSLLRIRSPKIILLSRDFGSKVLSSNVVRPNNPRENEGLSFSCPTKLGPFESWVRPMSTAPPRGRSMRSKVERRMRMESGKTMREVRRAKKIQKKLMTENERLVYNLKRAKKKVALLLQKLKKYDLPDLPPPVHDPELFTPEQLQAYKKIGFKNKNYAVVGVRGVFGGVVQNMHMHWKFHETVQVCCDNFPKEKIKEMAAIIARLSGGIAINVHNGKTIIMYRGRNYRQPQNLIPLNTLTKRKALFKARFEQALESQKLNMKKIEQQLRRSGINPEDPAATASIQRVASSFFNAIDKKEGTPYVFREDEKLPELVSDTSFEASEPSNYREQAELDKFIAEIEDAAEREWAAEEAAEKEDLSRIRYWNQAEYSGRFRRSNDEIGQQRSGNQSRDDDDDDDDEDDDDIDDDHKSEKFGGDRNRDRIKRNTPSRSRKSGGVVVEDESEALSDIESAMWKSDDRNYNDDDDDEAEQNDSRVSSKINRNYSTESEDEEQDSYGSNGQKRRVVPYESIDDDSNKSRDRFNESRVSEWKQNKTGGAKNEAVSLGRKWADEVFDSGESCSDSESDWQRLPDTKFGSRGSMSSDDEDESYRGESDSNIKTRRESEDSD